MVLNRPANEQRGNGRLPGNGGKKAGAGLIARIGPVKLAGAVIAIAVVSAFAGGVWYAYDQGVKKGVKLSPPLIKADASPTKIAPEDPGGMDIPNQDKKIFETMDKESGKVEEVERLLPPPEMPLPEQATPQEATVETLANTQKLAEATGDTTVDTTVDAGQVDTGQQAAEKAENIITAPPPPSVASLEKAPSDKTASIPAPEKPAPVKQSAPAAPNTQEAQPAPAKPETVKPQEPKAEAPAPQVKEASRQPSASPAKNGYRVQIASFHSADAAEKSWQQLVKRFPALLGSQPHRVQRVEISGKGVYHRLQAGNYPNRARAETLCASLKAKKQDCIIAKP